MPLNQEIYNHMIDDHQTYRDYVDTMLAECPELFPSDIQAGYTWHDILTTIKSADQLPEHLLSDEKHTRLNGEKAYIATTVASDCVLGASVALKADTPHLTEAYSHFQEESQRLDPDYQPETG